MYEEQKKYPTRIRNKTKSKGEEAFKEVREIVMLYVLIL